MIRRQDLQDRVREWSLVEHVVEKDYVIGWLLWGLGSHPLLQQGWAFKGGTCLKKCYLETYRFSEDLDFTVLDPGLLAPEDVGPILDQVLRRVGEESGIEFPTQPMLKSRAGGQSTEGRVYYRGPVGARGGSGKVKLDLTAREVVVRPTVLRPISHPYPDVLPAPAQVRCYSFEEVFAEKIRALAERCRPRDLYDVVNLSRRGDLGAQSAVILEVLQEKCRFKGIPVPTAHSIRNSPLRVELESEWANMLAHQLPILPDFQPFLDEVVAVFDWLSGASPPVVLAPVGHGREDDFTWQPPPTAWVWRMPAPLESVRFAGANRLRVELGYQGRLRVIEPYSLRRTRAGALLLYAVKAGSGELRSYRVDQIESLRVLNQVFRPRYAVEFSQVGRLAAPQVHHPGRGGSSGSSAGGYEVECLRCGRRFQRRTRSTTMRPHNDSAGNPCPGRRGRLVSW